MKKDSCWFPSWISAAIDFDVFNFLFNFDKKFRGKQNWITQSQSVKSECKRKKLFISLALMKVNLKGCLYLNKHTNNLYGSIIVFKSIFLTETQWSHQTSIICGRRDLTRIEAIKTFQLYGYQKILRIILMAWCYKDCLALLIHTMERWDSR